MVNDSVVDCHEHFSCHMEPNARYGNIRKVSLLCCCHRCQEMAADLNELVLQTGHLLSWSAVDPRYAF
jgi:hypothetical protein